MTTLKYKVGDKLIEGCYIPVDTKKPHTFKVGDRVRIRQWEDMAKEFGVNKYGSILCKSFFSTNMKHLCSREATISKIEDDKIELKDWSDSSSTHEWRYTTDMIEPVEVIFDTSEDCSDSVAYTINSIKKSKWTPEPAKYHNGDNWLTKSTVCIDGKEMTVEEFKAKTTLYRSALAAYNNYFPTK